MINLAAISDLILNDQNVYKPNENSFNTVSFLVNTLRYCEIRPMNVWMNLFEGNNDIRSKEVECFIELSCTDSDNTLISKWLKKIFYLINENCYTKTTEKESKQKFVRIVAGLLVKICETRRPNLTEEEKKSLLGLTIYNAFSTESLANFQFWTSKLELEQELLSDFPNLLSNNGDWEDLPFTSFLDSKFDDLPEQLKNAELKENEQRDKITKMSIRLKEESLVWEKLQQDVKNLCFMFTAQQDEKKVAKKLVRRASTQGEKPVEFAKKCINFESKLWDYIKVNNLTTTPLLIMNSLRGKSIQELQILGNIEGAETKSPQKNSQSENFENSTNKSAAPLDRLPMRSQYVQEDPQTPGIKEMSDKNMNVGSEKVQEDSTQDILSNDTLSGAGEDTI